MGFVHIETISIKRLSLQSYFDSMCLAPVVGTTVQNMTRPPGFLGRSVPMCLVGHGLSSMVKKSDTLAPSRNIFDRMFRISAYIFVLLRES